MIDHALHLIEVLNLVLALLNEVVLADGEERLLEVHVASSSCWHFQQSAELLRNQIKYLVSDQFVKLVLLCCALGGIIIKYDCPIDIRISFWLLRYFLIAFFYHDFLVPFTLSNLLILHVFDYRIHTFLVLLEV